MILEICTASVDGCLTAQENGANRIELNSALELGGLTPSLGVFLEAREKVHLPIIIMIRPRPGGFCYSSADFKTMQLDADLFLKHGASGIAFGILTPGGEPDLERCRAIVLQAGSAETVFHRAFDRVPDPLRALEELTDLGITRILTSGQRKTALEGAGSIARFREQAAGRIQILPAGGIRPENVKEVLTRTGCSQVHASASRVVMDGLINRRTDAAFNSPGLPEGQYRTTDESAVSRLRQIMDTMDNARL